MDEGNVYNVMTMNGFRWNIEQFQREEKELTGIERCQCRLRNSQKNRIICAILTWNWLKKLAYKCHKTIYRLKYGLLKAPLKTQKNQPPSTPRKIHKVHKVLLFFSL